jgi:hypothetical protein
VFIILSFWPRFRWTYAPFLAGIVVGGIVRCCGKQEDY